MPGRAPEGRGVRGLHLLLCKVGRASSLISAPTLWRSDEALRTHAERVPRIWVSHTAQPRTPEAPMQERSRSRHMWKGPTSATRARRNNTLHAVSQEEPFRESLAVPLQTRQQMPARAWRDRCALPLATAFWATHRPTPISAYLAMHCLHKLPSSTAHSNAASITLTAGRLQATPYAAATLLSRVHSRPLCIRQYVYPSTRVPRWGSSRCASWAWLILLIPTL